ncbi:5-carboxymethyl-2-hydroxymuconate isomerase [Trichlorobacter thiogenes]|uniref:5-carboxymethyl-2-hydroxymuconate isomerase n=1 Tax=Trichlorobacter thiogenes TaxID=115783 RepID=A0A1T4K740_9BACT|nr:fumarylacetoacetate hydrolase family protein [Trichlorobacter thiogenes]SJZ38143.1 5-carboxymethyl-2-hydroxymuconate isomerase [Trichlorobacter thiogenes]
MKTVSIPAIDNEYIVGKILCIGRNYVDHIKELGNEAPSAPIIFMKPSTAIIGNGEAVVIPAYSSDCHYEAELAVLIGSEGKDIAEADALAHVAGYGVAIDMTLRDVQDNLKKKGLPWEIAKGFDTSCPLSDFVPADKVADPQNLTICLALNGEQRQNGSTGLMINSVARIISYLSGIFTLEEGDVILTGTPAGVGRVQAGDRMEASIAGVGSVCVTVA